MPSVARMRPRDGDLLERGVSGRRGRSAPGEQQRDGITPKQLSLVLASAGLRADRVCS